MRTTLAVDDDVLAAVKERARREHRTMGEVISDLTRQSLTGQVAPAPSISGRHGFHPFPHRGPVVTNGLIDRLREESDE